MYKFKLFAHLLVHMPYMMIRLQSMPIALRARYWRYNQKRSLRGFIKAHTKQLK